MYTINYDSLTSTYGVNGKGKIVDILAKNYDITNILKQMKKLKRKRKRKSK